MLFVKGVAKIDLETLMLLAEPQAPIGTRGDYLDGRIFFATGPRIYSYEISASGETLE
ncbi:MAG: hypothetical protein O2954_01930 [bacterium]|nr:hypothetical protein [bacterium]